MAEMPTNIQVMQAEVMAAFHRYMTALIAQVLTQTNGPNPNSP